MSISVDDPKLGKLVTLIKDSFRVRPNHDPIYVDLAGNIDRVASKQHQVIFGRRGSGKSCLLVHFHRQVASEKDIFSIYVDADEIKMLGFPDVLIRLVLDITEKVSEPSGNFFKRISSRRPREAKQQIKELRQLLDMAEESRVTEQSGFEEQAKGGFKLDGPAASVTGDFGSTESRGTTSVFTAKKLDALQRHLPDYKRVVVDCLERSNSPSGAVIVDDFYLFHQSVQPDIVDYLHRLLRGTNFYLKIGTVRHRTRLLRHEGQAIGVELAQDVEEISLDRTFEDVEATQSYLDLMLDSLAQSVGINSASEFISPDGLLHLALASGGVPRDYLTTLVEAVEAARASGRDRVTPSAVYKGASRVSYRTKLKQLRDDVAGDADAIEGVLLDLVEFCLKEESKTGFLVSQDEVTTHEAEHEVIQQLMDFKLIHIIESDTSAASGRTGRFEAYTLDFALFMEPRRRGINIVEFWKIDDQRRRIGVREAPAYSLDRVATAKLKPSTKTEQKISAIQEQFEAETAEPGV
ncbi:MAG: hypothetical protein ACRDKI_01070 [Solirubrobacterales bacterium]